MTIHTHYHYKGSSPPLSEYDKIKYRLRDEDKEQAERKELAKATSSIKMIGYLIVVVCKVCFFPILPLIWFYDKIKEEDNIAVIAGLTKSESDIKKEKKRQKLFHIRILKEKYKKKSINQNINKCKITSKKKSNNQNKFIKKENNKNNKIDYDLSVTGIINFCINKHRRETLTIIFLIGVLIYIPLHEVLINWISPTPPPEPWFVFWK